MKKTQQTNTKLLVIAITTAVFIAAVTTTSLSAATPAFAKINCNEDNSICSGGESNKAVGSDAPGGAGGHRDEDSTQGGFGGQILGFKFRLD